MLTELQKENVIQGAALTTYCDEQRLSIPQRLELFIAVCQAVQSAHYKGIVHGSLTPSNVLVAASGNRPTPRVINFGSAAATRQKLADAARSGSLAAVAAELAYVSPEMTDVSTPADSDTRSDVYSLGVLLYELLTGSTPVPQERLQGVAVPEGLRLIREEQIARPSERVSESKERLATLASQRHLEPAALPPTLRGDLDCIVIKALHKDRTQRYDSANALARDLQRYLDDDVVEACPTSGLYRIWKEARKYPRSLAAAAVLLLLLLSAGGVGAALSVRATHMEEVAQEKVQKAEEESTHAKKEVEEAEMHLKQLEAEKRAADEARNDALAAAKSARDSAVATRAVLAFFNDNVLSAGRPLGWIGGNWASAFSKSMTLLEAVDRAEARVATAFVNDPLAEALIRQVLGDTYLDFGEPAKAVKQYERALALREFLHGPNDPTTVASRDKLAVAYRRADRPDDASRLFDDNPDTVSHAETLALRGAHLLSEKKPGEAETKLRESLAIREKIQPNDWTTFDTKSMLGEALMEQKKYADAEPLLLSGYEGLKRRESYIPSYAKSHLTQALERLVRLHEKWGKEDKAAEWRHKLEVAKAAENP
jgi:eukaryotic-like serine/threonine-protein kinase